MNGPPLPGRRALGSLVATLLGAVAMGAGLWALWWGLGLPVGRFARGLGGHGPDPVAWPRLLALWIPLGHVGFRLGHLALARLAPGTPLRLHARLDQATLVLVGVLAGALAASGPSGPWRFAIGAWWAGWVGLKGALFLHATWTALRGGLAPARVAAALFVAAWLSYLLLGAYLGRALSTTGDEPYYLLVTHSLVRDGDTDLANNLARRDYLPFYWDTLNPGGGVRVTAEGRVFSRAYSGLQPVLLAPGYALAGRIGATGTMAALSAAALALAFRLAIQVGARPPAAFLAWLAVAFSVPVLCLATSPWPEMSAAFFAVAGASCLLRDGRRPRDLLGALLCILALVTLKIRFVLVAAALVPGLVGRLTPRRLVALLAALGALLAAGVAFDTWVLDGFARYHVPFGRGAHTQTLAYPTVRPLAHPRALLGLLLDQEHGLLIPAPALLFALAGLGVAAVERRWRWLIVAGAPFVLTWYYMAPLRVAGQPMWTAGFSPPARFLTSTLPLLVPFLALAVDRLRGRLGWGLLAATLAGGVAQAALLTAWPLWRLPRSLGRAPALLALWERSGLDAGRWLPSYLTPGPWTVTGGLAVLGLALALLAPALRRPGAPAPRGTTALGLALATLALLAPVVAARWRPAAPFLAVTGQGRGGVPFLGELRREGAGVAEDRLVWAAQRDAVLTLAPWLPPGAYRVTVRAGAQGEAPGPTLAATAGPATLAARVLDGVPPPAWREGEHAWRVHWGGGRLPITLELRGIRSRPAARLAYVDTVRVERVDP